MLGRIHFSSVGIVSTKESEALKMDAENKCEEVHVRQNLADLTLLGQVTHYRFYFQS